ncbi:glucuronate isomerase [Vibrio chagasii]|nr:glucuronate isomerase [Vibrio chagasii]
MAACAGKVQFGSGWWFNDRRTACNAKWSSYLSLVCLASLSGMLTDSRSFLSYTRHEYFRRILCDMLGRWAENGGVPKRHVATWPLTGRGHLLW